MPSWLMQVGWDLQVHRSTCGWKMSLINWKTRPSNAKIFEYIENNQTGLVLRAINDGEASIHDRDEKGSTLIEVSRTFTFHDS